MIVPRQARQEIVAHSVELFTTEIAQSRHPRETRAPCVDDIRLGRSAE